MNIDIESQNNYENQRLIEAKKKNDEELDKICNKVCLICGWGLVICLFIYCIFIVIQGPPNS